MSDRQAELHDWLTATLGHRRYTLSAASGDASFRRYWRVGGCERTYIVMDAPPALEDAGRFVRLAERFAGCGLHTPAVYAQDLERGFLLLEDLGERLYLHALDATNADALYGDALTALVEIQARVPHHDLPAYDGPFVERELRLFADWLLEAYLGFELDDSRNRALEGVYVALIDNALEQPRVCVHRDYHSRNLMVTTPPTPGILDFQDAVVGPIAYDLVSLLRDCYVEWPPERIAAWLDDYMSRAVAHGLLAAGDTGRFRRWFDLMGVQRHLKASGIFARLAVRDGKPGYLDDIPRTLGYVREVALAYDELAPLVGMVEAVVSRLAEPPTVVSGQSA